MDKRRRSDASRTEDAAADDDDIALLCWGTPNHFDSSSFRIVFHQRHTIPSPLRFLFRVRVAKHILSRDTADKRPRKNKNLQRQNFFYFDTNSIGAISPRAVAGDTMEREGDRACLPEALTPLLLLG